MSHLQFFSYKPEGAAKRDKYAYEQSVRVGDRIECSGQGGWSRETGEIPDGLQEQMDQTFSNIDYVLRDAGGKGWSQVYRVNTYHVGLDQEGLDAVVRNIRQWMPDHKPLLTVLGVEKLADPKMKIEIEVVAHAPQ